MADRPESRVFTIAAGLPFLKTVAEALCDGRLVPSFRQNTSFST